MTRIKIKDLPKGMKISEEELKSVRGGLTMMLSYTGSPIQYVRPQPLRPVAWPSQPQYESGCGCMGMPQDPVTVQAG